MHVFRFWHLIADKGNDPAEGIACQCQASFFLYFPKQTFLWRFILLKMSADTDPFVLVHVILLRYAMQHEITIVLLDVAKCCQITCLLCAHLMPFLVQRILRLVYLQSLVSFFVVQMVCRCSLSVFQQSYLLRPYLQLLYQMQHMLRLSVEMHGA